MHIGHHFGNAHLVEELHKGHLVPVELLVGTLAVDIVLAVHMAAVDVGPVLDNPAVAEHMALEVEHTAEVERTAVVVVHTAEVVALVFAIVSGNHLHSEWGNHLFHHFSSI